jgi:hypothetical protein
MYANILLVEYDLLYQNENIFMPALPREIRSSSLRPSNTPLSLVPTFIHICEYLNVIPLILTASNSSLFIISSSTLSFTHHEILNIRGSRVCSNIATGISCMRQQWQQLDQMLHRYGHTPHSLLSLIPFDFSCRRHKHCHPSKVSMPSWFVLKKVLTSYQTRYTHRDRLY